MMMPKASDASRSMVWIASQKALHGSARIVGSLRRGSRSQRRDHGSTHDQHDDRDKRGARNATEHARDDARDAA